MGQQEAHNTFGGGLISDLNPITTPNTVLTDCKNGTFITYNGNELVLQNDMGNTKIVNKTTREDVALSDGFIPVGVKEYGGVVYIVSHNPENGKTELGSFPSPLYGSEATVLGKTFTLALPADLDKNFILSDQIFKPGDPFIINIPTVLTDFTKNGNRKIYKLRIISIGSSELDITDYFAKDLDLAEDSINDLTLTDIDFNQADYATHLAAKKVLYYPNNVRSGKLALKVILENIETFQLTNGPVADNINDSATEFDLLFRQFFIEHAASLKVGNIDLKYWYTRDGVEIGNNPLLSHTLGTTTNNYYDTSADLKLRITDRKQFLNYEIIPNANYTLGGVNIAFKDFIIRNQIDLSKNDFDWILKILFKKITNSYVYTLDGSDNAGNITKTLLADDTDNEDFSTDVPMITCETPLFQNLKFFTTASTSLVGDFQFYSSFSPVVISGGTLNVTTMRITDSSTVSLGSIGSLIGLGFDVFFDDQWRYVGTVSTYNSVDNGIALSREFPNWEGPTFPYRLVKKVGAGYQSEQTFTVSYEVNVILGAVSPSVSLVGGIFVCQMGSSRITSHVAGSNVLVLEEPLQGDTVGEGWQVRMGYTNNYKISLKTTNAEIILKSITTAIPYKHAGTTIMDHSVSVSLPTTFPFASLIPDKDYKIYVEMSCPFLANAWVTSLPAMLIRNTAISLVIPNKINKTLTPLITPTGVVKGAVSKFYRAGSYAGDITNSAYYRESLYKSENEIISNGDFTTEIVQSSSEIGIWYGASASRNQSLHFYADKPKFYIVLNQGNKIYQILPPISDSVNYTICFYATGVGIVTIKIGATTKTVNTTGDWKLHHVTSSFPNDYPIEFTATSGNISITNISMQIGDYIERPDAWSLVIPTHNFITATGQYIPTTEYNLKGVYTVNFEGVATFTNYDAVTNPIVPTTTDNLN